MITDRQIDQIIKQVESGLISMMGYKSQSDAKIQDNSMYGFISKQYDIRLSNMLEAAGTNIHHLESGTKNRIILQRQKFFEGLKP